MKKLWIVFMSSLVFGGLHERVNIFPILSGKRVKEEERLKGRKLNAPDLIAYREGMGWEEAKIWLQRLPQGDFHVILTKSKEPISPELFHQRFIERVESGCPRALAIRAFYIDTLGIDFCDLSVYPILTPLPSVYGKFTEEELAGEEVRESAFGYVVLPGKSEELVAYFHRCEEDSALRAKLEETRKGFGICKIQYWLQQGEEGDMLVVYKQSIKQGELARRGWIEKTKNDPMMRDHAATLKSLVGLSAKEMLPDLELME